MPTLYIVPTPIGNLEDVTLRALRVLGEVGLIAAEDTRVTRRLLDRYEISTPMTSFHEHNRAQKLSFLLRTLAESDVALVSDAGTPTINDPGQELVHAAAAAGVAVVGLPGATAVTTAVAVSGIPHDGFVYLGFLPRRRSDRLQSMLAVAREIRALVAFETPHRLAASLRDLLDTLGDRQIAVCRELTKVHEEVFRGSISDAIARFDAPRGEFTLVVSGSSDDGPQDAELAPEDLLADAKRAGLTARDAIAAVGAVTGLSRRELYQVWLTLHE